MTKESPSEGISACIFLHRGAKALFLALCGAQMLMLMICLSPNNLEAQAFLTRVEGFETGFDGWSTDNTNIWKVGNPTVGPGKSFDGTNCAGTALSGNVPAWQTSPLISPVFVFG